VINVLCRFWLWEKWTSIKSSNQTVVIAICDTQSVTTLPRIPADRYEVSNFWIFITLSSTISSSCGVFTRSSKHPALHLDACWKFAGSLLNVCWIVY